MSREEVLQTLAAQRETLTRLHVRSLALFGSAARNEAQLDSDLDFVVEFDGPATFDRHVELSRFLEGLFGRPVDLLTRRSLKPSFLSRIEEESYEVAGQSPVSDGVIHLLPPEHRRSLRGAAKPYIRKTPLPMEELYPIVEEAIAGEYMKKMWR